MGPRQLFYPHTPSPSCPASTSPPSPLHPPAYYLSFPTQPRSLHNILSVSSLHYSYLLPHYIFLKVSISNCLLYSPSLSSNVLIFTVCSLSVCCFSLCSPIVCCSSVCCFSVCSLGFLCSGLFMSFSSPLFPVVFPSISNLLSIYIRYTILKLT